MLKEKYKKEIIPYLMKKLKYKNYMAVPKLEKIVINMGLGETIQDPKILDEAMGHLELIAKQKPIITKARKSVSAFKLRKGKEIGCKVTLRGNKMFEFLERLIKDALPRVRDFRGLNPNSFDKFGNYSFGVSEQLIFPEVPYDKVKHVVGMDITMCVKCKKREDSFELLKKLGLPFRKESG